MNKQINTSLTLKKEADVSGRGRAPEGAWGREDKRGEQDLNELQTSMQLLKNQQKLPLKERKGNSPVPSIKGCLH